MNLFMMCEQARSAAFTPLPPGIFARPLRKEELDTWLAFPYDTAEEARQNRAFMLDYFQKVYQPREAAFFKACTVLCGADEVPLATAFLWRSYGGRLHSLHWLKTLKEHEGRGLGRALLSLLLGGLGDDDYPVYLHTHPECVAAISLYADFGFELIEGSPVGRRSNDLAEGLAYLKREMRADAFKKLVVREAPRDFYEVTGQERSEF